MDPQSKPPPEAPAGTPTATAGKASSDAPAPRPATPARKPGKAPPPPPEHRWKPGQSGNPGGRAVGLRDAIRAEVGPEELAKIAASIARGELQVGPPVPVARKNGEAPNPRRLRRDYVSPSIGERLDALEYLRDTGWGKPIQQHNVDANVRGGGIVIMLPPESNGGLVLAPNVLAAPARELEAEVVQELPAPAEREES